MAKLIKDDIECYWFLKSNNWFVQIILPNQLFRVNVENYYSDPSNIIYRVPQGSILRPLMCLIYVNDMPQDAVKSNLFLYSDDSGLDFQRVFKRRLYKHLWMVCESSNIKKCDYWKLLPKNSKNFFRSSYHKQHWQYKSYY